MTDLLRDELTALTCDLVRFESVASRPDQLSAVIDYVESYLATIPNIAVERSAAGEKPAIVATLRPTRAPRVMLNGHLDVVVGHPAQFAPAVRDGRIYGRGSQDMKGSVAVMLRLLKDLAALPEPPDVGFQFVTDEEIGGFEGTRRLLEDEGWRCEVLLCLEPTDMGICYAHKGSMWAELLLPGSPAHGSRPWAGHNPVGDLVTGMQALAQIYPTLEAEAWRTTVTPTEIQVGGGSRNQVPGSARLTFDVRYVPEDSADQIVANLQHCFPTAQVVERRSNDGLHTDPEHPEVIRLAEIIEGRIGHEPRFYREHFATDARFYSHAGIPAVCVGPVGAGLHSDEEWVAIDSLVDLYCILDHFITS